jgi:hypothetical protein
VGSPEDSPSEINIVSFIVVDSPCIAGIAEELLSFSCILVSANALLAAVVVVNDRQRIIDNITIAKAKLINNIITFLICPPFINNNFIA